MRSGVGNGAAAYALMGKYSLTHYEGVTQIPACFSRSRQRRSYYRMLPPAFGGGQSSGPLSHPSAWYGMSELPPVSFMQSGISRTSKF